MWKRGRRNAERGVKNLPGCVCDDSVVETIFFHKWQGRARLSQRAGLATTQIAIIWVRTRSATLTED